MAAAGNRDLAADDIGRRAPASAAAAVVSGGETETADARVDVGGETRPRIAAARAEAAVRGTNDR